MSLIVSLFQAPHDASFEGDTSFGFERYRTDLWGTDTVRATGVTLIPQLADRDVYVGHEQLDAIEAEANTLLARARETASVVFDEGHPGPGAVVADGQLHDAFGPGSPTDSINRYLNNLLRCISLARHHKCGVVIW